MALGLTSTIAGQEKSRLIDSKGVSGSLSSSVTTPKLYGHATVRLKIVCE